MAGESEDLWPPTMEQLQEAKTKFLDAICPEAVCRLASRYHHASRPCRVFGEAASGSFNACFFVELDDEFKTQWNVRVAVGPALVDAWAKVQSEVATMRYVICSRRLLSSTFLTPIFRYIRRKTTIPVARVYAYGRDEDFSKAGAEATSCVFSIFNFIPGHAIDSRKLVKEPKERVVHLYEQIIDILAQLRQLEFDESGSLYPDSVTDDNEDAEPVMGDLLCIEQNELQKLKRGRAAARPAKFKTTADYALYQYRLIEEAYELPIAGRGPLRLSQMEVYALYDLKAKIVDVLTGSRANSGNTSKFVLTHTDFRWNNIIVDDNLNIQAVIDWEWSGTIPQQFFMPPTWLSGDSPNLMASQPYRKQYALFYETLKSMAEAVEEAATLAGQTENAAMEKKNMYRTLVDEWGPGLPRGLDFPVSIILRHHYHLVLTYFFCIFPKFVRPFLLPREFLHKFFEMDEAVGGVFSEAVRRRREREDRYTTYLEEHGLYTKEEMNPKVREWLEKKAAVDLRILNSYRERSPGGGFRRNDTISVSLRESFGESVLCRSIATWNQDI